MPTDKNKGASADSLDLEYALQPSEDEQHSSGIKSGGGFGASIASLWNERDLELNNMHVAEHLCQNHEFSDLTEEQKIVVQRLALKSFHLPGYSYWEDWSQFVCNNHIILSFCLAHPLHPFGRRERIVNLISSLAFGLIATCCVVLYYFHTGRDLNKTVLSIPLFVNDQYFDISSGMIFLGIFGGICNVLFDFGVWFLQACPCCQPGGLFSERLSWNVKRFWIWLGTHLALEIAIIGIGLALYVSALRASVIDDGDISGLSTGIEDYAFIASFLIEAFATQFFMFPLVAGTIFTGILGCGRIPGLGGRPYQVWREEQQRLQEEEDRRSNRGRTPMAIRTDLRAV